MARRMRGSCGRWCSRVGEQKQHAPPLRSTALPARDACSLLAGRQCPTGTSILSDAEAMTSWQAGAQLQWHHCAGASASLVRCHSINS